MAAVTETKGRNSELCTTSTETRSSCTGPGFLILSLHFFCSCAFLYVFFMQKHVFIFLLCPCEAQRNKAIMFFYFLLSLRDSKNLNKYVFPPVCFCGAQQNSKIIVFPLLSVPAGLKQFWKLCFSTFVCPCRAQQKLKNHVFLIIRHPAGLEKVKKHIFGGVLALKPCSLDQARKVLSNALVKV